MRRSKVLAKLRAGKVARICCTGSPIAFLPAVAAHYHYDGIWLDGEHRAWEAREIETMLGRHHAADIDCMWRPPTKEKNGLYRLLEDGARRLEHGVLERDRVGVASTRLFLERASENGLERERRVGPMRGERQRLFAEDVGLHVGERGADEQREAQQGVVARGGDTRAGGWRLGALVTLGQIDGFEDLPSGYAALRESAGAAATP